MEPTINDVLSGRGAWFNQHPGNEHFRRMLEEKKIVYMTGTKKQKMDMSKAIVESIYSMEPPGRFLKQCPGETGQWKELSRREAADKAAQAMAYAIKGDSLKEKRRERRRSRLPPSLRLQQDDVVERSSQSDGQPTNNHNPLGGVPSSPVARHGMAAASANNAESAVNDDHASDLVANGRMLLSDNSNLQQQLVQQLLQLSSTTTLPTSSGAPLNANQTGLVQVLAQALQQRLQQQQQHQQLPLQHTLGQDSDSSGLQTQTPLQPSLLEGLTQVLCQTQQQQQQNEQQQLLLQRLLNQQTVFPSASLPLPPTLYFFTTIMSPFLFQGALLPNDFFRGTCSNYSAGSQYEPAHNKILQNQKEHNALLLSVLRNQPSIGTSIAPQSRHHNCMINCNVAWCSSNSSCWGHPLLLQINCIIISSSNSSNHCRLIRFIRHDRQLYFVVRKKTRIAPRRSMRSHRVMLLLYHLGKRKAMAKSRAGQDDAMLLSSRC